MPSMSFPPIKHTTMNKSSLADSDVKSKRTFRANASGEPVQSLYFGVTIPSVPLIKSNIGKYAFKQGMIKSIERSEDKITITLSDGYHNFKTKETKHVTDCSIFESITINDYYDIIKNWTYQIEPKDTSKLKPRKVRIVGVISDEMLSELVSLINGELISSNPTPKFGDGTRGVTIKFLDIENKRWGIKHFQGRNKGIISHTFI